MEFHIFNNNFLIKDINYLKKKKKRERERERERSVILTGFGRNSFALTVDNSSVNGIYMYILARYFSML